MRYIGSKQRLLDAIVARARSRGFERGHTLFDVFAGTAVVGRRFKEEGFRVVSNDRMQLSYVLQQALVVADEAPPALAAWAAALESAPPTEGLATRCYSPAGPAGRGYFTAERARQIDGALALLDAWRRHDEVSEEGFYLLLAGVLEGASAIANISGTYGAFLKTWQPNALAPFRVRTAAPVAGLPDVGRCEAFCADANALVRHVECDLLYIDPPYNGREYNANYHVLETLAASALARSTADREALEARIYGKTGLRPYTRSAYCSRRQVAESFARLIRDCRARAVLVSYSEEGLLSAQEIVAALAGGLGCEAGAVTHERLDHTRFRSDRDRAGDGTLGSARAYRPPREGGRVHEWLFFAERPARASRASRVRDALHQSSATGSSPSCEMPSFSTR